MSFETRCFTAVSRRSPSFRRSFSRRVTRIQLTLSASLRSTRGRARITPRHAHCERIHAYIRGGYISSPSPSLSPLSGDAMCASYCATRAISRGEAGASSFFACPPSLPPPPPTERANCFDPCLNCPETAIAQDPTIKRHGGMRRIAHSRSNACKDTHFYYTLSIRIRVTFRREILYHESPRKVTQDCCIPLPKFRDSTIIFISRIINK